MDSNSRFEMYQGLNESPKPQNTNEDNGTAVSTEIQGAESALGQDRIQKIGTVPQLRQVVELPVPGSPGRTHLMSRGDFEQDPQQSGNNNFKQYAILVKSQYDEELLLLKHQLEIQSDRLKKCLQAIGRPYRSINVDADTIIVPDPFLPLFFLREQLEDTSKATDTDPALKQEVDLLLSFINSKEGIQDTIDKYNNMVKAPSNKISFDMLWTLYPPNILVYQHDSDKVEQCFIVESAELHFDFVQQRYSALFSLIGGGHDGTRFGLYRRKMSLPLFSGIVDINAKNLPIVSLEYLEKEERERIQQRLISRGKKYLRLQQRRFSFRQCDGDFMYPTTTENKIRLKSDKMRLETNHRIIVDANAAAEMVPIPSYSWISSTVISTCYEEYLRSFSVERKQTKSKMTPFVSRKRIERRLRRLSTSSSDSSDNIFADKVDLPSELQGDAKAVVLSDVDYLLCPHYIDAYLIDRKIWIWASVSNVQRIQWRPNPWADLQLEQSKKDMIRNLVRSFNFTNEPFEGFDDVVQGKGKGLIFLLHGAPGLGKTMTAELIAEQTHRPLYHLTTGQLGTDMGKVETELEKVFKLGWRWGAVVLLDEADVLLAERTVSDLERSGIVAVFLRLIEFYRGLLFLTTNREKEIDDAFKNRIHVSIEYKDPDPQARTNIWKNLLTKKREKINLDKSWTEEEFATLGELCVNGRDIRNIIRTAYGYAKSKKTHLGVRHVRMVIKENCKAKNADDIVSRLDLAAHRSSTFPPAPLEEKDYDDSTESPVEESEPKKLPVAETGNDNEESNGNLQQVNGEDHKRTTSVSSVHFVEGDVT